MSLTLRLAGIPHQDEIAPGGLRFFHIELRPGWKARLAECSGKLDQGYEDARGGPLFWLAMQLFRETFAVELADPLCVVSLLAEVTALAARLPLQWKKHAPLWLARVLDKLHSQCCSPLTLPDPIATPAPHPRRPP